MLRFLLVPAVLIAWANGDSWGPYGEQCLVGKEQVYNPADSFSVKWYNIDLDEDPRTRWNEVGESHGKQILAALDTVKMFIALIDVSIYDFLVEFAAMGVPNLPEPYHQEIIGMAKASGLSVGEVALLNLFYEIKKGCTSIVARDKDGEIYHARNQDFGFLFYWNVTLQTWQQTMALKDLVININYIKDGKVLFKGVTFAGHLGTLTGIRPQGFSISTNARFGSVHENIYDFFVRGLTGRSFLMYADRDVLTKCSTYEEAYEYLTTVPLLAPGYFILGGRQNNQGAVITRGPDGAEHVDTMNQTSWYVLQTNYDWDKKVIYLDDRRGPGHDCMNKLGTKNVNLAGLFQVLSSKPNLNKATVYTSVMHVNAGTLESFIRDCQNPCCCSWRLWRRVDANRSWTIHTLTSTVSVRRPESVKCEQMRSGTGYFLIEEGKVA
ncbi:unnamed protein product [Caenorhabditis auriculariae]|uniref:Acid ceramidase n=1 Tax=Caenorhabditis auriculariae TaxID=2777116 RepID=A0A8S1HFM7_9PELO|nr:unnamed protein product [Caenorhabditis auriculariae]